MSDTQSDNTDRKALARRNKLTALVLGLVALLVYLGYFVYRTLT